MALIHTYWFREINFAVANFTYKHTLVCINENVSKNIHRVEDVTPACWHSNILAVIRVKLQIYGEKDREVRKCRV